MGKSKEILKLDVNGILIETFKSTTECSTKEGMSRKVLSTLIKNTKPYNGFIYKFSGKFSDEIDKSKYEFKCPFCNKRFETYNGLSKHIENGIHGYISKEELLTIVKYNGVRPTCKCGCGGYTALNYQGGTHFLDYISGHHSRIHNNWGHNEIAKQKSSETRRKQYKSGERKQWNKGKKWNEVYTIEQIERLRNNIIDKMNTRISTQQFSLSSQFEKEFIDTFIKPLNIDYKTQYYLKEIHQYCDVFIPEKNLIIECDGSFWHADPRLFPNGAKYEYQKIRVKRDELKNEYAKKNNITILRFWEIDIRENKNMIIETLKKHIF